ncbi:glycosyltransferase family 4 protein [Nisaea denitrificans]|uniref:glycosyltransferase family 4 protein n=1 Tax=Nisaea denitrificans TaxID=390877 RepID=UPI0003F4C606|nr:glycosyltransferase family 4 protein [Nisaea denitrificans]
MKPQRIGISWAILPVTGWGIYGYQIIRYMSLKTRFIPVMLEDINLDVVDKLEATVVSRLTEKPLLQQPDGLIPFKNTGKRLPIPILHARGTGVQPQFADHSLGVIGSHNHALTFFENANIRKEESETYKRFASVTAGSTWNGEILKNAGVEKTSVIFQGVDPAQFHPAPKKGLFGDRFVIFAGGKMEYRKGQDIALAALKIFIERHPETLLLCIWDNQWPHSSAYRQFSNSPHLPSVPAPNARGHLQIDKWFEIFGLSRKHVYAFTNYPHRETQGLMREADVALFPNRCEGGTNLVAMETMACGIPTIISSNTGHLDIIHEGACIPLKSQSPVPSPEPGFDTTGWGESSVEEIVEQLEYVYQNRERAAEIGLRGAQRMHQLSWDRQVSQLLTFIEDHGLS